MEVDASSLGVGAGLSQQRGEPPVVHPFVFFSKKRSPIGIILHPIQHQRHLPPRQTKADALSRIHSPDPLPEELEPVLPLDLFVCPITWSLDDDIRTAPEEEPAPPVGPEGRIYVPTSLRISLLDLVHASPGSGQPGRQRTLSLLKGRYWWPNMAQDVAPVCKGILCLCHYFDTPSSA